MDIFKRIHEEGFKDFLWQLVDGDHLEGASLGITKKIIDQGIERLSKKQLYVFQRHVLEEHTIDGCQWCKGNIAWEEMYIALDTGSCCQCNHSYESFMKEKEI